MPSANFTPAFMAKGLVCPPGKSKIEYGVAGEPGLFVECRASAKAVPTWYLRLKKATGTNVYKNLGTINDLTLAQARKRVVQLRAEHARELSASALQPVETAKADITLDVFMRDHYMPDAKMHKRSAKKDEQLYRLHIAPKFRDYPLGKISRHEVQVFHNELVNKKGQSHASADHSIKLMRRALNLAVQWEFVEKNPLNKFKLFMKDNQVDNSLSEEEVDRLVKVLKADDNRVVSMAVMFLLVTGARLNEALTAKWDNIKLDPETETGVWKVDASISKSKRSRTIPLNSSAVWVLSQLDSKRSTYVFPSPVTGKPYTAITRAWYRLRKKAGINCRIHDLRHTFASVLASKGRSLYVIQRILGHADSRMTQRYAHLSIETLRDAANEMAVHRVA